MKHLRRKETENATQTSTCRSCCRHRPPGGENRGSGQGRLTWPLADSQDRGSGRGRHTREGGPPGPPANLARAGSQRDQPACVGRPLIGCLSPTFRPGRSRALVLSTFRFHLEAQARPVARRWPLGRGAARGEGYRCGPRSCGCCRATSDGPLAGSLSSGGMRRARTSRMPVRASSQSGNTSANQASKPALSRRKRPTP